MVSDSHRFLFSSRRRKAVSSEGAIRIRSVPRSRQSLAFTREKKDHSQYRKTWRVNFSVLAREQKNSRAATKKFSRRFSGKHAPQSERFRLENFILPLFDIYPFPSIRETAALKGGK